MMTGDMFDPVVDHFAERHRVIVPDLRGHGRSRDLPPPYDAAQLAADLAVVLDDLGISSAAVLGYSQGGAIAQQFALDHPERCDHLILACTYAYNMATPREKVEGVLGSILLRFISIRRLAKFGLAQGAARSSSPPRGSSSSSSWRSSCRPSPVRSDRRCLG
jgi:3-oxoadipate enol-lactonase